VDFLVRIVIALPVDLSHEARRALLEAETARGRQLAESGELCAIWRVPGRTANVSIYRVADADRLHELLGSLPLFPYMDIAVEPRATHPLGRLRLSIQSDPEPVR
jgi:muconolactone D-isomerase